MAATLANATNFDASELILVFVLVSAGGIAVVFALAGAVVFMARTRMHPYVDLITVATLFWGLLAIGSVVYAAAARMNWSRQYGQNLLSGNYDPTDVPPAMPWGLWIALTGIYFVLLIPTVLRKRRPTA